MGEQLRPPAGAGKPLARGALYTMLKNPIYRGRIVHKDQQYPGEHEAVIDEPLWEDVQAKLATNAVDRSMGERVANPSLLAGLLFDAEGHRMSPTHANKNGRRYRYYASRPLIGGSRAAAPDGFRIPAGEIEQLVAMRIGQFFSEPASLAQILADWVENAAQQRRMLQRAAEIAASWSARTAAQVRPTLATVIRRIVVGLDRVDIHLLPSQLVTLLSDGLPEPGPESSPAGGEQAIVLSVPAPFRRVGLGIKMLVDGAALPGQAAKADPKLVKLIVRAHRFNNKLAQSGSDYLADIAQAEGMTSSYFTRVLRLAYLAPDITRAILDGRHPAELTAQKLLAHSRLPLSWPEQRRILGFA